ncbi:hypothetical protein CH337_12985 [Rhodoblastus acidophilus]|nr:hypothetical protein CKO16_15020 [Rhodoblastus acidophilus]RAI19067.1 hypothetical protein CH337_12985 [Rhodoblastus acidophilus]
MLKTQANDVGILLRANDERLFDQQARARQQRVLRNVYYGRSALIRPPACFVGDFALRSAIQLPRRRRASVSRARPKELVDQILLEQFRSIDHLVEADIPNRRSQDAVALRDHHQGLHQARCLLGLVAALFFRDDHEFRGRPVWPGVIG